MSRNWKLTALQGDSEFTALLTEGQRNRTNILLQNGDFTTTWTAGTGTAAAAAPSVAGPRGTISGTLLVDDAGTGTAATIYYDQNIVLSNATAYTVSVYAKANGNSWLWLVFDKGVGNVSQYYQLSGLGATGTAAGTPTSTSIELVGNGWYRCILTATTNGIACGVTFHVADADEDVTVARDGTSSIYLAEPQIEAGAVATTPISTTTVARQITGATATNQLQDDVHIALETVLEVTNQSTDDLWQRYKRLT